MTRRLHPIIKEICLDDYEHQHLHASTSALFDINEVLMAIGAPTSPHYQANAVTGPEDGSTAAMLLDSVQRGEVTTEQLYTSHQVIERYDALLRHAGYTL